MAEITTTDRHPSPSHEAPNGDAPDPGARTHNASKRPPKRRRPFGVNAMIVLSSLSALYGLTIAAAFLYDMSMSYTLFEVGTLPSLEVERWLTLYFLATSVVQVAIVIGLWRLRRWGWFLVMLHTGAGMVLSIWAYFFDEPNYFVMAVSVLIVLYMNQRDVQQAFYEPKPAEALPHIVVEHSA